MIDRWHYVVILKDILEIASELIKLVIYYVLKYLHFLYSKISNITYHFPTCYLIMYSHGNTIIGKCLTPLKNLRKPSADEVIIKTTPLVTYIQKTK